MTLSLLIKPASSSCNMRCSYCFYHDVSKHRDIQNFGIMSDETAKTVIRRAFDYGSRQITFAFQGGEPTLAGLSFFKNWVKWTGEANLRNIPVSYAIQTNGIGMDEEWASFFHEHDFLVGISLDGPKDIHNRYRKTSDGQGSFKTVMKAIGLLETKKVSFNILTVVNQTVAKHPMKVYNFLKKHNLKYLQFIPCLDELGQAQGHTPLSVTADQYGEFLVQLFELWYRDWKNGRPVSIRMFDNLLQILIKQQPESCDMRGTCSVNAVIEADGSIYPCDFYVVDQWKFGNLHESSLQDLTQSPLPHSFVNESRNTDEACSSCDYYALCRGGCKRHKEPKINGYYQANRFCASYKRFYKVATPRLIEVAHSLMQA